MFCSKCGTQLNDDAKFCNNCGNALQQPNSNQNSAQQSQMGDYQILQQNNRSGNYQFNQSIYQNQFTGNAQNFYVKIRGFKTGIDCAINWVQFFAFIIPLGLGFLLDSDGSKGILLVCVFISIIAMILSRVLNPQGIFIDTSKGIIISNKEMKLNFLKKTINISDIKEVIIEKYKIPFLLGYNIFDMLFSSRKFDNVSLKDDSGKRILSTQFIKDGNKDEYIQALQNAFNILGRNDIIFKVDNQIKNNLDELQENNIKNENNKNNETFYNNTINVENTESNKKTFFEKFKSICPDKDKYKKLSIILFVCFIILIISLFIFRGSGKYIDLVKNGAFQVYPNITIEELINGAMYNPKWKQGQTEDGINFVNVSGLIEGNKVVIQFKIHKNENSWEVNALEINGQPMPTQGIARALYNSYIANQ